MSSITSIDNPRKKGKTSHDDLNAAKDGSSAANKAIEELSDDSRSSQDLSFKAMVDNRVSNPLKCNDLMSEADAMAILLADLSVDSKENQGAAVATGQKELVVYKDSNSSISTKSVLNGATSQAGSGSFTVGQARSAAISTENDDETWADPLKEGLVKAYGVIERTFAKGIVEPPGSNIVHQATQLDVLQLEKAAFHLAEGIEQVCYFVRNLNDPSDSGDVNQALSFKATFAEILTRAAKKDSLQGQYAVYEPYLTAIAQDHLLDGHFSSIIPRHATWLNLINTKGRNEVPFKIYFSFLIRVLQVGEVYDKIKACLESLMDSSHPRYATPLSARQCLFRYLANDVADMSEAAAFFNLDLRNLCKTDLRTTYWRESLLVEVKSTLAVQHWVKHDVRGAIGVELPARASSLLNEDLVDKLRAVVNDRDVYELCSSVYHFVDQYEVIMGDLVNLPGVSEIQLRLVAILLPSYFAFGREVLREFVNPRHHMPGYAGVLKDDDKASLLSTRKIVEELTSRSLPASVSVQQLLINTILDCYCDASKCSTPAFVLAAKLLSYDPARLGEILRLWFFNRRDGSFQHPSPFYALLSFEGVYTCDKPIFLISMFGRMLQMGNDVFRSDDWYAFELSTAPMIPCRLGIFRDLQLPASLRQVFGPLLAKRSEFTNACMNAYYNAFWHIPKGVLLPLVRVTYFQERDPAVHLSVHTLQQLDKQMTSRQSAQAPTQHPLLQLQALDQKYGLLVPNMDALLGMDMGEMAMHLGVDAGPTLPTIGYMVDGQLLEIETTVVPFTSNQGWGDALDSNVSVDRDDESTTTVASTDTESRDGQMPRQLHATLVSNVVDPISQSVTVTIDVQVMPNQNHVDPISSDSSESGSSAPSLIDIVTGERWSNDRGVDEYKEGVERLNSHRELAQTETKIEDSNSETSDVPTSLLVRVPLGRVNSGSEQGSDNDQVDSSDNDQVDGSDEDNNDDEEGDRKRRKLKKGSKGDQSDKPDKGDDDDDDDEDDRPATRTRTLQGFLQTSMPRNSPRQSELSGGGTSRKQEAAKNVSSASQTAHTGDRESGQTEGSFSSTMKAREAAQRASQPSAGTDSEPTKVTTVCIAYHQDGPEIFTYIAVLVETDPQTGKRTYTHSLKLAYEHVRKEGKQVIVDSVPLDYSVLTGQATFQPEVIGWMEGHDNLRRVVINDMAQIPPGFIRRHTRNTEVQMVTKWFAYVDAYLYHQEQQRSILHGECVTLQPGEIAAKVISVYPLLTSTVRDMENMQQAWRCSLDMMTSMVRKDGTKYNGDPWSYKSGHCFAGRGGTPYFSCRENQLMRPPNLYRADAMDWRYATIALLNLVPVYLHVIGDGIDTCLLAFVNTYDGNGNHYPLNANDVFIFSKGHNAFVYDQVELTVLISRSLLKVQPRGTVILREDMPLQFPKYVRIFKPDDETPAERLVRLDDNFKQRIQLIWRREYANAMTAEWDSACARYHLRLESMVIYFMTWLAHECRRENRLRSGSTRPLFVRIRGNYGWIQAERFGRQLPRAPVTVYWEADPHFASTIFEFAGNQGLSLPRATEGNDEFTQSEDGVLSENNRFISVPGSIVIDAMESDSD